MILTNEEKILEYGLDFVVSAQLNSSVRLNSCVQPTNQPINSAQANTQYQANNPVELNNDVIGSPHVNSHDKSITQDPANNSVELTNDIIRSAQGDNSAKPSTQTPRNNHESSLIASASTFESNISEASLISEINRDERLYRYLDSLVDTKVSEKISSINNNNKQQDRTVNINSFINFIQIKI
jgi:hypothetical protein